MDATVQLGMGEVRRRYREAYSAGTVHGPVALAQFLPDSADPDYLWILAELVRADLDQARQQGMTPSLDEYRRVYPELFADEVIARGLADEAGVGCECPTVVVPERDRQWDYEASYLARTPPPSSPLEWTPRPVSRRDLTRVPTESAPPAEATLPSAQAVQVANPPTVVVDASPVSIFRFPQVNDTFLGFRLIGELGRGAFARVYLAEQIGLAERLVALKIAARATCEPQQLAKLRHTNIMPIYSVHDLPPLQAVCMPYLGHETLADLIQDFCQTGVFSVSKALAASTAAVAAASTLGSPGTDSPIVPPMPLLPPPRVTPALREALAGMTHEQLVFWVIARVAEGLAHAHDRGILHLDLKPANILIGDDGQPMLLDFNLAFDTRNGTRERTGGTIPYMAPEQLEEYRDSGPPKVDHRTDLYALGVVLFELLSGKKPFPTIGGDQPNLNAMIKQRRNTVPSLSIPGVSKGAEAIVHKLIAANPAKRYQSAQDLLTDLDCHARHLPLKFAANRSIRERVVKWRKRNPRMLVKLALVGGTLTICGLGAAAYSQARTTQKAEALNRSQRLETDLARLRVDLAIREEPTARVRALGQARHILDSYGLIGEAPRVDPGYLQLLSPGESRIVCDRLGEMCLLMAHAEWLDSLAPGADTPASLERARAWNQLADVCYKGRTAPSALTDQRKLLAGEAVPPGPGGSSSIDLYLCALRAMAVGRYSEAIDRLEELTDHYPGHFAAQFQLGICRQCRGDYPLALERYRVAQGLMPTDARPAFNRGVILMTQGKLAAADKEFTDAISRDGSHAESYRHRAMTRASAQEKIADLNRALEMGAAALPAYLQRMAAHQQAGDLAAAERDKAEAAKITPITPLDFFARGNAAVADKRIDDALADYARATQLAPNFYPAWQNQAHIHAEYRDNPKQALVAQEQALRYAPEFAIGRVGRAVLLARIGRRAEAHDEAKQAQLLSSEPRVIYQAACVYALTGKKHPEDLTIAIDLLRKSIREGYRDLVVINSDHDLDTIRSTAEFQEVLTAARVLQK